MNFPNMQKCVQRIYLLERPLTRTIFCLKIVTFKTKASMKIGPAITIAVLSIRLSAFAQTVPANPILWLDASKGVIPENGHIARWLDQSGNGNDVSMSDTLHQPDLTNDSGRPAILFHGWDYLQGPPIFPANHDYTIAVVAKLTDTSAVNNLVSGNIHALYFANNRYPRVVHYWFQYQEVSPVPIWTNGFSAITARYDQAYEQATLDVNGRFADSGWVQATTDSTLYIGSYLGGYFLNGEIEEVLLYNRTLDSNENASLQNYLMSRFEIPEAAALPKPDSTMTSFPTSFQMFPRGMDDSATVPIAGVIYRTGFDSVSLLQLKNEFPVSRATHPLVYHNGNAAFQFSSRIHAEVSEYRFEVHLIHSGFDSIIAECDSIACGDLFMMDGQSNAFKGFDVDTFRNEFCRTLELRASENLRDTVWHESGGDVGAADQRIQQDLLVNQRLPSSSINEAIGGSPIEMHLPNDSNHYDLRTIYGLTLYRITKMGMASAVHAIFWLQGESNYAPGYYQKFLKLYTSWKEDYPNLQKIYLLQIRPNYCTFGNLDMRDVQRHMEDSISVVEPLAAAALPFQDGCHYYDSGYRFMGDRFYRSLARDFYHAIDTANLRSPNATWAWWTRSDHSQVGIIFSPWDAILRATDDTTVNGIFATL